MRDCVPIVRACLCIVLHNAFARAHRIGYIPGRDPSVHYTAFVRPRQVFSQRGTPQWTEVFVMQSTSGEGPGYFEHLANWTTSWINVESGTAEHPRGDEHFVIVFVSFTLIVRQHFIMSIAARCAGTAGVDIRILRIDGGRITRARLHPESVPATVGTDYKHFPKFVGLSLLTICSAFIFSA